MLARHTVDNSRGASPSSMIRRVALDGNLPQQFLENMQIGKSPPLRLLCLYLKSFIAKRVKHHF